MLIAAAGSPAAAQPVGEFYKGKQVEFIIAAETGSIYDTWGRMLSRYMPKYVPGNPTFVTKNMPGAGHIRAASYSFNAAPKDGTSIITFSHNMPASFVMGNPGIKFDVSKFQWLGSPDRPGRMCVVRPAGESAEGRRSVRTRTAGRRRGSRRRHQPDAEAPERPARNEVQAGGRLQGRR